MGSVLPRSSVAQTPPLGSPKCWPTAGADGPKRRPTFDQSISQLCQIEPTAKLANFRDAKIRRKAHDESKGGSRARARSRSKARSRAGNPVPVPCRIIVYQWGFCSLATSVAKKPADTVNGLSRHILDRQRAACLRYSTVPLTAPVIFCHLSANANPHPIGIRCPRKKGLLCPSFWLCGHCAAV